MNQFNSLGLDLFIGHRLGLRSFLLGYQYSEIISSILWIYFCGGNCIEDIGTHFGSELEKCPHTRIPSPDI
jgi:transposase